MMEDKTTETNSPPFEENVMADEEDDQTSAARILNEAKQVLVELSADQAVEVDEADVAEPPPTMMKSLSFRVGFSRFAAPLAEIDVKPIEEGNEEDETEEERLVREQREEEHRKLEKMRKEVAKKKIELVRIYEIGKTRRRQYKTTENAHIRDKNAVARTLWRTRKSHHMNPLSGMKDYKKQMFKVSLPCHDSSNSTLAHEAKLLKVWHSNHILDHQMEMLHEQQELLISFLHKGVMNEASKDREEITGTLKEQVEAARTNRDELQEAYEARMAAQRKYIGNLKLKEMADDEKSVDSTALEAAKLAAGEIQSFEATKLRRSAELRIEAKFGSLKERKAKKEIRQEVFNKTLENVEEIERTSMERAKNISGEIQSVLSSIHVRLEEEDLSEHPIEEEPADTSEADADAEADESKESTPPQPLDRSFKEEPEEEVTERNDDDDDLGSHRIAASPQSTKNGDEHSQSSKGRVHDRKEKADISARLEMLRAKRQQQQQQVAARVSSRKLGSSRNGAKPAGDGTKKRVDLLQRARSARSARLVTKDPSSRSLASTQSKDAKLAELRERRRNRAATTPATVAES
ncbi:unnamed protein product [Cylindrotheca closterium]|uniref:Uncharacterized protein n=1 Tax=Cylindrotheca closterium TaxID=2856 RepID=A0AAD2PXX0_9STRA|nr:unnamed protein product [Cylindrotheca closterium]